jgi:hypothetical protein
MGKAAALPYQMLVGRRCRAAQTSTERLFSSGIEIESRRRNDEDIFNASYICFVFSHLMVKENLSDRTFRTRSKLI